MITSGAFFGVKNIHKALKPQGVLVCEFGASGNIATIENAFAKACKGLGYDYEPKFNFPTAENFSKLLENNGFIIDRIYDYDRPAVLKDNEAGLVNFMKQFFASELALMPEHIQDSFEPKDINIRRSKAEMVDILRNIYL